MGQCFWMCIKDCHKSGTKVAQECHKSVTRVSQECHKSVTRVSQECHKSVTRVSQKCHKSVTKVSTIGTKCHIGGQPIKMCDTLFERSTSEIYESSPYFEMWNKVFDSKSDQSLEHPIGYGPSNGFYVMLHSFEASRYQFH